MSAQRRLGSFQQQFHSTDVNSLLSQSTAKINVKEYNTSRLKDPHTIQVHVSFQRSLRVLYQRGNYPLAEAWLPSADGKQFTLAGSFNEDSKDKISVKKAVVANKEGTPLAIAYTDAKAKVYNELNSDLLSVECTLTTAQNLKLHSCYVVPVISKDAVVGVFKLFSNTAQYLTEKELERMTVFISNLFIAGVYRATRPVEFNEDGIICQKGLMYDVYRTIAAEQVFNSNLIYHEVDWFFGLGLPKRYYSRFSVQELANHCHSFIAAKKLAETIADPEDIWLDIQNKSQDESYVQNALFMAPNDPARIHEIEKRIQRIIAALPNDVPFRVEYFTSSNTIVPRGKRTLALYVFNTSRWSTPTTTSSKLTSSTSLSRIAAEDFIRDMPMNMQERYQEVLKNAAENIEPVFQVYEPADWTEGCNQVFMAFRHARAAGKSKITPEFPLLKLTQLLLANKLSVYRKYVTFFSNGFVVYSVLIKEADTAVVDKLAQEFSMVNLMPNTAFTPKYLSGEYTPEMFTYATCVSKFIYYFLNRKTEEYVSLSNALKNDAINMSRLRFMAQKREVAAPSRIQMAIVQHPKIFAALFAHFMVSLKTKYANAKPRPIPADLKLLIKKEATTESDRMILEECANFNCHLLKSNFFKRSKAAVAFRLDASFIKDSDYPAVPYAIFFMVGAEFQGFHVRFADIARGGIRVIRSIDQQVWHVNMSNQFTETYNLAYTQNLKNKDIPEFGAKGTVLMDAGIMDPWVSFQKYISSMLDLIGNPSSFDASVVDNYGQPEILFLGPDEYTGDKMAFASQYAHTRNYPFWRAFTTGKPPGMGGIPHDTFGMTTRGVHTYVLGALAKCGLKEEEVTKFQTGGPDGDLGSNEILLSNDKTIAVCDSAGVLYDPNGLNREELRRLARARVNTGTFDASKLGPGGFKVSVSDKNVKLPSGQLVESGLQFRNEFPLTPMSSAQLFVPCGGRPETINLRTVRRLFDHNGSPRFKIIIEGANLFITQDARLILEEKGVVLYKDASANKGGVTSSSREVMSSLCMSEEEFAQNMLVKDKKNPPVFYMKYVKSIQEDIVANAKLEFNCIWNEHARTGIPRCVLTNIISDKINEMNMLVQGSKLYDNMDVRVAVLKEALSPLMLKAIGFENIMKRVPDAYMRAIFGCYLGSRYVYQYGIAANAFSFFDLMQKYVKAPKQNDA
eukprot:TRINITY_DN97_c0_g2_i1.p1 TRINITY_DN97_c0_g2~~TRINITY_DN97_c0_g2_i1.p1  ORF type:complete len:1189 (-),score=376.78 TRINITY_DN97_c0_g2_i1:339-3905(-)